MWGKAPCALLPPCFALLVRGVALCAALLRALHLAGLHSHLSISSLRHAKCARYYACEQGLWIVVYLFSWSAGGGALTRVATQAPHATPASALSSSYVAFRS